MNTDNRPSTSTRQRRLSRLVGPLIGMGLLIGAIAADGDDGKLSSTARGCPPVIAATQLADRPQAPAPANVLPPRQRPCDSSDQNQTAIAPPAPMRAPIAQP